MDGMIKKIIYLLLLLIVILFTSCKDNMNCNVNYRSDHFQLHRVYPVTLTESIPHVVTKTNDDYIRIRFIALKHSYESMADGDARLAINAAEEAASKGLRIKVIGNYNINRDGKRLAVFVDFENIDKFREFISEQMKIDAEPGDTFMIFTIGHGFASGGLQNMGQRKAVMEAIAQAATENQQKTFWWQLSCHATAALPSIDDLPSNQRQWLSIVASSSASNVSAAYVEGKIMKQMFNAMATKDKAIDPDGDGMITGNELKKFLNTTSPPRGSRCFTEDYDAPIFGFFNLANRIPILDWMKQQRDYPRDYIPYPRKR